MCKSKVFSIAAIKIFLLIIIGTSISNSAEPGLEQGFKDPPDSSKPRVWWHWTGGNVTREGITKDLEWMKRIGIGGAQIADIGIEGGQKIKNKITFFQPEWFDAVRYAATESDRLGLELSIFSSSGWSLTGGPWVKPEQAMKKLVWNETGIKGPMDLEVKLREPPSNPGAFGSLRGSNGGGETSPDAYYRDSVVLAYRTPPDETLMEDLNPEVTASGGKIDPGHLMDDRPETRVTIVPAKDGIAWVEYKFPVKIRAKAVTLMVPGRGVPFGKIQVSDDNETWRTIVNLPGALQYRAVGLKTYAFPEVSARFVRVTMTAAAPAPDAVINQTRPTAAEKYELGEFIVHTGARVDRWQDKAGFNLIYEYDSIPTPSVEDTSLIKPIDVIDLTSRMDSNGILKWKVPAGKWTILRMGYSLVGSRNRAGTPAGVGLEVDKLNARHVESYFKGYMAPIEKALGPYIGRSLQYMVMDSWEAGMQNWTDDMIIQFQKKRGYDPTPWLPVLTGRIVGSSDKSDRFLWDFRRTIADLVAEAHYGTMASLLAQKGMGLYSEAPGVSMEILEDTLLTKSKVDIPMGEFWLGKMHPPIQYYVDVHMAASAAHVYGKKIVAAESFTGGGYDAPATYKNLADYWFAQGINRIIFHSSAHQPLDTKPGNTMVGTHFNRNITWADQADGITGYMSRVSFMLQQGLFQADIAYLLNEGAPSSQPFWGPGLQSAPPEGYNYDTINADVLLNRMTVSDDGRLVLPDGMSYRVLVIPETDRIRPELLRKIKEFAAAGAVISGPRPLMSPSLQNGADRADSEVSALANEIWGDLDGLQRNKHFYGKGLVTWGLPLEDVLSMAEIPRDVEFDHPLDSSIAWTHRKKDNTDIYFIANLTDYPRKLDARFRVEEKEAELWHPDTGEIEPSSYVIKNGRTIVPLYLEPHESLFVLFRDKAESLVRNLQPVTPVTLTTLKGSWEVIFPPGLGAPEKIRLDRLESWTENAEPGVKYFSGTATYKKTIKVPGDWLKPETSIIIDLGKVKDIATIKINGKPVTTLWKQPYRVEISKYLKTGANRFEISVTNQWTNRRIGDRELDEEKRILASEPAWMARFGPPENLAESGLIGPVTLTRISK